jgi:hypothetical protein
MLSDVTTNGKSEIAVVPNLINFFEKQSSLKAFKQSNQPSVEMFDTCRIRINPEEAD